MEKSISKKIVRNTVYNIVGKIWAIIPSIILTPYIIGHIGLERYGIWALVSAVTGYFALFDFRLDTSFIKYISEFHTKGQYNEINQVVNTGIVFYAAFTILIVVLGMVVIEPLVSFFNITTSLKYETGVVFLWGFIIFGISRITDPIISIQLGLQRMDISNKLTISLSILQVIVMVFFLQMGYGLIGLMYSMALVLVMGTIFHIIIAYRILPQIKINPFLCSKGMFKKLSGFSYKIQISAIANWIQGQLDKTLLAYFLNIKMVSYYNVANNLLGRAKEIPVSLTTAILPAAAELDARMNKDTLNLLYFRALKYVVLISLPLAEGIILFADSFIFLWLGGDFKRTVLTLQILIISYFFNILTAPGAYILNGIGKPQYAMFSALIAIPINLVLSISLVIKIGYYGVVIGTAVSLLVSAIYFLLKMHHLMRLSIFEWIRKIFVKPLIVCLILFAVGKLTMTQINMYRWDNFLISAFTFIFLFWIFLLSLNYFDDFDKALANRYLPIKLFKVED